MNYYFNNNNQGRWGECPECFGKKYVPCIHCEGTGREHPSNPGSKKCSECNGTGRQRCQTCFGMGEIKK